MGYTIQLVGAIEGKISKPNLCDKPGNEFARLILAATSNTIFNSTVALFNIPHLNALQRYQEDYSKVRQLNRQGKLTFYAVSHPTSDNIFKLP